MSNAEFNISEKRKTDTRSTQQDEGRNVLTMRRFRPLLLAGIATIGWLAISSYGIHSSIGFSAIWNLDTLTSLSGGILLPIVLFWLVALVFQRTDPLLERRVSMIQNLNTTLAPIDSAEQRLKEINKSIHNQFESIEAIADIASNSIDKLEKRFDEQTTQLFAASAEMEIKSTVIRDRLTTEREAFHSISENIDEKLSNINDAMAGLKTSIEGTNKTVGDTIDTAIEKTREQAEVVISASHELTTNLDKSQTSLAKQNEEVMQTSDAIESRLAAVNDALIINTDRLRDDITQLDTFASGVVESMKEEVIFVEEMSEKALVLTEKIENSLSRQVVHVQEAADSAMQQTLAAGGILNEHAVNIASSFAQIIENARETASKTVDEIASLTKGAKQQSIDDFAVISAGNKSMAEEILASSHEVTNLLDETLARARLALAEISEQLSRQGDRVEQSAKSSAETAINTLESLHQRLNNSLNLFTETVEGNSTSLNNQAAQLIDHANLLANSAEHATEALKTASGSMHITGDGFGQSLEQNRQTLSLLEADLSKQQDSLGVLSQTLNETLNSANINLEDTSRKLRKEADDASSRIAYVSDSLAVNTQNIIEYGKSGEESIANLAEKIRTESQHVRVDLDLSTRSFETASTSLDDERKRIKEQVEDIGDILRTSSDRLRDRIEEISKAASSAAGSNDSLISDLSGIKLQYETAMQSALNQFQDALTVAEDGSDKLASTLTAQADKVRDEASSFVSKTEEIEDRIAKATKDDFLRSSNALIDSLQSTSIDIDRLLENEIPDDIWEKYLAGDRSIFARRTVKLATKESKTAISDKFVADAKFREHVARFMKDFESIMERSMHGDKGSAMSITIISSTMGKLYVLLAQSLKKLH